MVTKVKGLVSDLRQNTNCLRVISMVDTEIDETLSRESNRSRVMGTYALTTGISIIVADGEKELSCLIFAASKEDTRDLNITIDAEPRGLLNKRTTTFHCRLLQVHKGKNFIEAIWRPSPERE